MVSSPRLSVISMLSSKLSISMSCGWSQVDGWMLTDVRRIVPKSEGSEKVTVTVADGMVARRTVKLATVPSSATMESTDTTNEAWSSSSTSTVRSLMVNAPYTSSAVTTVCLTASVRAPSTMLLSSASTAMPWGFCQSSAVKVISERSSLIVAAGANRMVTGSNGGDPRRMAYVELMVAAAPSTTETVLGRRMTAAFSSSTMRTPSGSMSMFL
mmetsp:Transcript_23491/g.55975  ORF Transcript_23491/g.55975 Transcript_23491/m.55975 type:complete len:213 (-) Transcript_23491:1349-1987(-)